MSCPICGEETRAEIRPFCSRRCADIDLARWVRGDYAIPGRDGDAAGDPGNTEDTGAGPH